MAIGVEMENKKASPTVPEMLFPSFFAQVEEVSTLHVFFSGKGDAREA
ncbi:MAG: hypothetical protein JRJ16_11675 [Deltaproteobacteria bacterium]|nr:hypothetical protein [Deltaproteobacteria bacterium]